MPASSAFGRILTLLDITDFTARSIFIMLGFICNFVSPQMNSIVIRCFHLRKCFYTSYVLSWCSVFQLVTSSFLLISRKRALVQTDTLIEIAFGTFLCVACAEIKGHLESASSAMGQCQGSFNECDPAAPSQHLMASCVLPMYAAHLSQV